MTGGIVEVTRAGPDLRLPADAPAGETWRYGLVLPFQAAPRLGAAYCNIRIRDGVLAEDQGGDDFEVGVDLALFDSVDGFRGPPLVLSRNHEEPNPRSRPAGARAVMVKYPARGGFVPFGARRGDGSAVPRAGTGFALNQALARRIGPSGSLYHDVSQFAPDEAYGYFELRQLVFDGSGFRIVSSERVAPRDLLPGWEVVGEGLTNAIADGDDFLLGMSAARPGSRPSAGVMRFSHDGSRWRPTEFHPVTEAEQCFEASVVRDGSGALLFTARASREPDYHDIRVWRSNDTGATWTKQIHVRGAISSAPVTINQAADGTPYVGASLYQVPFERLAGRFRVPKDRQGRVRAGGWTRRVLCLWPIRDDRAGLAAAIVARDCDADFGPPPGGSMWRVDHPSGAVVQLGDGAWHGVLGYRIHEDVESRSVEPPPQTGAYLEEVRSAGAAVALWRF